MAAALRDLEAVAERLGLQNPAVVGMSYGGWVAAHWARRHPQCPGVVTLDGVRAPLTAPENYVGMDAARVAEDRAKLEAAFSATGQWMAEPIEPERVEAMVAQRRDAGFPDTIADAGLRRNLAERAGKLVVRPLPDTLADMQQDLTEDLVPVFRELPCPVLVVVATENLPGMDALPDLMSAYRRGLDRDLDGLAETRPDVQVVRLDATHAMVFERPHELADLVAGFLGNC